MSPFLGTIVVDEIFVDIQIAKIFPTITGGKKQAYVTANSLVLVRTGTNSHAKASDPHKDVRSTRA